MKECIKIKDLMSDYIDNELNAEELAYLERHIHSCDDCKEEINQLKSVIDSIHSLEQVEITKHFHNEMMKKIKDEVIPLDIIKVRKVSRKKHKRRFNRNYIVSLVSSVAVIFMILFIGDNALNYTKAGSINNSPRIQNIIDISEDSNTLMSTRSTDLVPDKVRNYQLELEVSNLENAINEINNLSGESTFQSISNIVEKGKDIRMATITKKVSLEDYYVSKNILKDIGIVKKDYESTVKINNENFELQLKQEKKQKELNQLTSLVVSTEDKEDLLKINERITELETEISLYRLQIENIFKDLSEPSIEIILTENVKADSSRYDSFNSKIKESFINSVDISFNIFEKFILVVSSLFFPITVIFIGFVTFILMMKFLKKRF